MRYLLIFLLLASCATDKSATKYFDKHPDKGSGYCAAKYPVRVGDVKVSEQDWSDTADTFESTNPNTFESPQQTALEVSGHDTLIRTINHYHVERDSIPYIDSAATHNMRLQIAGALQTNTALQNTIIANNKAANAKYDALEAKNRKNSYYKWALFILFGGMIVYRIYRFIF